MQAIAFQVSTVLGDARPASRWFGDGSVNCPFCTTPIRIQEMVTGDTACRNPWCDANPAWKGQESRLQARRDKIAAEQAEDQRRRDLAAWRVSYAQEQRIAREQAIAEQRQECIDKGACLRCSGIGEYRFKPVKHRKECPKGR